MQLNVEKIKTTKIDWVPRPAMARFVRKHRPDVCKSNNFNKTRFVSLVNFLQAFPYLKREDPWLMELLNGTSPPIRKRSREESPEKDSASSVSPLEQAEPEKKTKKTFDQ